MFIFSFAVDETKDMYLQHLSFLNLPSKHSRKLCSIGCIGYFPRFSPLLLFHTLWKHQKTRRFLMFLGRHGKKTMIWNGLTMKIGIINPVNIYLFKVSNRNTRKSKSKLTIKTRQRLEWHRSRDFIFNVEHILHLFLLFLLLTLNK